MKILCLCSNHTKYHFTKVACYQHFRPFKTFFRIASTWCGIPSTSLRTFLPAQHLLKKNSTRLHGWRRVPGLPTLIVDSARNNDGRENMEMSRTQPWAGRNALKKQFFPKWYGAEAPKHQQGN